MIFWEERKTNSRIIVHSEKIPVTMIVDLEIATFALDVHQYI